MTKQTFITGQVLTAAQMTSLQQTAMGGGSTTAKTASYVLVAADAGTVVQMNSASATTITVNTALFAAGDTVQIQNVGSGVCTVTAGTATVSTSATLALKQYDAGTLYFNTTSAAFFFAVDAADTPLTTTGDIIYSSSGSTAARLGIGTTSQVLTVASGIPSWATPVSSVTFAGAAVYKAAGQAITANTWTTLLFDTENYDTNTFHSTATNTGRMTIPSGAAGYYTISILLESNPGNAGIIRLLLNGSTIGRGLSNGYIAELKQDGATSIMFGAVTLSLAVADYLEVQFYNPTGVTTVSQTYQLNYLGA